MNGFWIGIRRWPRAVRASILLVAAGALAARAQSTPPSATAPTPTAQFQYASMTGSGNTISATRIPVINAKGQVIYQDIAIQFDVDADGNVTLTAGYPTVIPSPNPQVSSFQPGKYIGPSLTANGKALVTVSGPGVSAGGSTQWSLAASAGADPCTRPVSATWYVGDSTPFASRLKQAGITSSAWSFGVVGGTSTGCTFLPHWEPGVLIGVSQTGNTITIVSFSICGGCTDSATPVDQMTYTLVP